MKNKKSLLSVLLAAVLLCACVAGMLITSANAGEAVDPVIYHVDENSTGTAANPGQNNTFQTINAAMEYAFAQTWPAGSSLEIRFAQNEVYYDCSGHNTLFKGQRTAASALGGVATGRIVRQDNEGLPITVQCGDGTQTLTLTLGKSNGKLGWVYVVNDFIIKNTKITWLEYVTMNMQVAAERVEFYNCEFVPNSVPNADHAAHYVSTIAANGYTSGNYSFEEETLAARRDADGKIQSEIVFSGNTTTTMSSEEVNKVTYYYGVFIAGQYNVSTSNFKSSVAVGEDSVLRSDLVGKITVKDEANLAYVAASISSNLSKGIVEMEGGTVRNLAGYSCPKASTTTLARSAIVNVRGGTCTYVSGMLVYPGIEANTGTINENTTVEVKCYAGTYNEVACATGNGLTMKDGSSITVDVLGGQVKQRLMGIYSGSAYGVKMEGGSVATLNVSGGNNHCVSTSSYSHRLLGIASEYAPMEICEGATLNINLSGADTKVGRDIYCIYGASNGSTSRVPNVKMDGALNFTLTGGTYNDIYGVFENVKGTTTNPSVGVGETGVLKIDVNGATVSDVTLAYNGDSANGAGTALVAGAINLNYLSGKLGNITGVRFPSTSPDTLKEITGSITVTMNADTEYDKDIVVLGEGAVVNNGGSVGVVLEKGTFSGSVQTLVDEPVVEEDGAYYVTVKGGTFKGTVSGEGVALAEGAAITIQDEGQINASTVEKNVVVTTDNQGFDKIYMTAATGSEQVGFVADQGKEPIVCETETGYEVRGWYLNPEISLIWDKRVELKAIFDKATVLYYKEKPGDPTLTFKLGETELDLRVSDLVENGEDYEVIFAAAGAADFDLPLEYVFDSKSVATTSIQELAASGAEIYKDTSNEAIFKALVDYGAAANNEPKLAYFNAAALESAVLPTATGVERGESELQLSKITLVMGDTLGIRYKLNGAAEGVTVKFNGTELASDEYVVNGNNVDIYVSAKTLNSLMPVEILDASKNTVVTVDYAVSNIAAMIYKADQNNLRAAAVLELVLAIEATKTVA